mgnify:CR=1 FL=1
MTGATIRAAARVDIERIVDYLADDSIEIAERFRDAVVTTLRDLIEWPRVGRVYDEIEHARLVGLRKWHVRDFPNHLIFYRAVERDAIEVIRVIHAARDLEGLLDDPNT